MTEPSPKRKRGSTSSTTSNSSDDVSNDNPSPMVSEESGPSTSRSNPDDATSSNALQADNVTSSSSTASTTERPKNDSPALRALLNKPVSFTDPVGNCILLSHVLATTEEEKPTSPPPGEKSPKLEKENSPLLANKIGERRRSSLDADAPGPSCRRRSQEGTCGTSPVASCSQSAGDSDMPILPTTPTKVPKKITQRRHQTQFETGANGNSHDSLEDEVSSGISSSCTMLATPELSSSGSGASTPAPIIDPAGHSIDSSDVSELSAPTPSPPSPPPHTEEANMEMIDISPRTAESRRRKVSPSSAAGPSDDVKRVKRDDDDDDDEEEGSPKKVSNIKKGDDGEGSSGDSVDVIGENSSESLVQVSSTKVGSESPPGSSEESKEADEGRNFTRKQDDSSDSDVVENLNEERKL